MFKILNLKEIKETAVNLLSSRKQLNDSIALIKRDECSFQTVIAPLARAGNNFSATFNSISFPNYVSTDKELRDASAASTLEIEGFEIEQGMRSDIYQNVKYAMEKSRSELSGEDLRLGDFMLRDFRRNGLDLMDAEKKTLEDNQKKLSELSIKFSQTVGEDSTFVLFTKDELDGLPESYISNLEKEEKDGIELYKVTMKYPDLIPALKSAKNETTRQKLDLANSTRCKGNQVLLETALKLRRDNAELLGFESHCAFKLEVKMAKNEKNVWKLLDSLKTKLLPLGKLELAILLDLKYKEKDSANLEFDGKINNWDFSYYSNILLKEKYKVNHDEIQQYFPLEHVTKEIYSLYEKVLGVTFKKVTGKYQVWHPEVTSIEVYDVLENGKEGALVGIFHNDLFPRDGKYGHAACFPVQPGFEREDGTRNIPIANMVANFTKPGKDGTPSLLKHNEVVTFYHELGHVMHHLCSQTKWSRFHGTETELDFVEAPSQMLENWCWQPKILKLLSKHKDTGLPLPQSLITSLVKSEKAGVALATLRQLFFATFDMKIHGAQDAGDLETVWADLRREITLVEVGKGVHSYCTFGHIMGGYDAGYYGYLWSKVFSTDMFVSRFLKEGVEGEGLVGGDYRKWILRPGGSFDGEVMLEGFLGREPNEDAFLKSLVEE